MVETTLTRVGNSVGVLLPKNLRQSAMLDDRAKVRLSSPRKGVVIITSYEDGKDRLERLKQAEGNISEREKRARPWIVSKSAEKLIEEARDEALSDLLSI